MTPPPGPVTWIKVEKPVFDLVGVVLSSFKLAGLMAVLALVLGGLLGYGLILRHRRTARASPGSTPLRLDPGGVVRVSNATRHSS